MDSVEESVRRIEKQVQRLWIFAALLALAFVLAVLVPTYEHRASRFDLVDESGALRATLRAADRLPVLILSDANRRSRAYLGVDREGTSLHLSGETGALGLALTVARDHSSIRLSGPDGKVQLQLRATADGPAVEVLDRSGRVVSAWP